VSPTSRAQRADGTELPRLAGGVIVVAVAILVFGNALRAGFLWDDRSLVSENPDLAWKRVPSYFVSPFEEASASGSVVGTYYRPLVLISFLADRAVHGLSPFGFHLTNALLHALCSLLLVFVHHAWIGPRGSLLSGLLFAVHPIHTEPVAWVSGRTDLVATALILGSVLAYLRSRRAESPRLAVLATLLLFLALLSKETALLLPVFFCVLEWVRPRNGAALRLAGPLVLLAVFVVFLLGVVGLSPSSVLDADPTIPGLGHRMVTAGKLVVLSTLKVLVPVRLDAEWEPSWVPGLSTGWILWLGLPLTALTLAIGKRVRHPHALELLAFGMLFLVPVLQIVPIKEVAAERFLYLPSCALVMTAAVGLTHLPRRPWGGAGVSILLALLAFRTTLRNDDWKDGLTLFAATAEGTRGNPRALFNLARELQRVGLQAIQEGRMESGRDYLRQARGHFRELVSQKDPPGVAWSGLADSHFALGEIEDGFRAYEEGIAAGGPPELRLGLAGRLLALGDDEGARGEAETLLRLHPDLGEGHRLLGLILYRLGDAEGAEKALLRAVGLGAGSADVFQVLGTVYARQQRVGEAVDAFQRALAMDPEDTRSMGNLAKIHCYTPGDDPHHDPGVAIRLLERALRYETERENLDVGWLQELYVTYIRALRLAGQSSRALEVLEDLLEALEEPEPALVELRRELLRDLGR